MRVERLVSIARPAPPGGLSVHVAPLLFGVAGLASAGWGAYRRWSPGAPARTEYLLVDRYMVLALCAGLVLLTGATLGLLASRGLAPALVVVTSRGVPRWVSTPMLWATRVRPGDALTVGIARNANPGWGAGLRIWVRGGQSEASFPWSRSPDAVAPTLVLHRPDLARLELAIVQEAGEA